MAMNAAINTFASANIGATSGIVVAGAVFTLPALYVLGIDHLTSPFQLFVVPFFGCVLGVLFLIPFRRYFVADMHGKLPFPEGTATTEILMAGESGGRQAIVLVIAAAVGSPEWLGAQCVVISPDDEIHCPYHPVSREHDVVFLDLEGK